MAAGLATAANEPAPEGEEFEQAALDFVTWCGPCHGRTGIGDGPVVASLNTKPSNLTLLKQRAGGEFPSDEVFKRVDGRDFPAAHGTPEMPVWGYWFKLQATAAGLAAQPLAGVPLLMERIRRGEDETLSPMHRVWIEQANAELTHLFGAGSAPLAIALRVGFAADPTARTERLTPHVAEHPSV